MYFMVHCAGVSIINTFSSGACNALFQGPVGSPGAPGQTGPPGQMVSIQQ